MIHGGSGYPLLPHLGHVHRHLPLVEEPQNEDLLPWGQGRLPLAVLAGKGWMSCGVEAQNELDPCFFKLGKRPAVTELSIHDQGPPAQ